jgi:putative salt-induced outer membrane protein
MSLFLKPALFYLLIVNLIVLGVNAFLFLQPIEKNENFEDIALPSNPMDSKPVNVVDVIPDQTAESTLKNTQRVAAENKVLTKAKTDAQIQIANLKESLALEQAALAKLQQEQQQQNAQFIGLSTENQNLVDKLSTLDNQVNIQESYLAESLKREEALTVALQKQKIQNGNLLSSPINRIKTAIDQQPDLLKNKKISGDKKAISDADFIDIAVENHAIKTDIVDANEEGEEIIDPFTGAVEFGFNFESDNQLTKSAEGRLILDYDIVDQYNINSDVKFEFENEDGDDSKNKFRWQLQGNYNLDEKNLVFLRSDIQRAKFASYEQEDTFTTGYGRIFFNENNHKFNTEFGPGYKLAVPNDGEDEVSIDEFILRTRLNYERIITESLQVTLEGTLELGKANSAYQTEFRAQNRIYQQLYLIFDVNYEYNQNVPDDNENQELSTGLNLQYAF